MESYLRLAALEFNNPVQDTAHYALALTLDYFETYDNLHNSDRHYIFCQLYFKSAYRNASEVKKSMHLSVSVATLCRYRKKFVEAFIYYCNLLEPSYFDDLNKTTGFFGLILNFAHPPIIHPSFTKGRPPQQTAAGGVLVIPYENSTQKTLSLPRLPATRQ